MEEIEGDTDHKICDKIVDNDDIRSEVAILCTNFALSDNSKGHAASFRERVWHYVRPIDRFASLSIANTYTYTVHTFLWNQCSYAIRLIAAPLRILMFDLKDFV